MYEAPDRYKRMIAARLPDGESLGVTSRDSDEGSSPLRDVQLIARGQLAPFFAASARSGLALVWKIVLVVEAFGRSSGVGYRLSIAFQEFDVSTILAYALAFILIVQAIEFAVLQPLQARVNAWRR